MGFGGVVVTHGLLWDVGEVFQVKHGGWWFGLDVLVHSVREDLL